ncbi:Protein TolB [bacterium HR17]|uniref:Protein TolB n=1 Tax=Candidatus Fervidibacter japonicus TaxID=2035412 RepID=A0A2H5XBQ2_9BACT|nr:Protein TolB [bacterium HR17]
MVTDGVGDNIGLYLTANAFTSDGEHIVFASDRTGAFQFYLLNLKTGKVRQLTHRQGIVFFSGCVSGRDRLYYSDGRGCYGDQQIYGHFAWGQWRHELKYFQFYHRPLSVVFAIEGETRRAHAVWGDHMFIMERHGGSDWVRRLPVATFIGQMPLLS